MLYNNTSCFYISWSTIKDFIWYCCTARILYPREKGAKSVLQKQFLVTTIFLYAGIFQWLLSTTYSSFFSGGYFPRYFFSFWSHPTPTQAIIQVALRQQEAMAQAAAESKATTFLLCNHKAIPVRRVFSLCLKGGQESFANIMWLLQRPPVTHTALSFARLRPTTTEDRTAISSASNATRKSNKSRVRLLAFEAYCAAAESIRIRARACKVSCKCMYMREDSVQIGTCGSWLWHLRE